MKVASAPVVFEPVTVTFESKEELQFFFDVLGSTTGAVNKAYKLPDNTLYNFWKQVKPLADSRGVSTMYGTGPVKIDFTVKGK